MIVLNNEPFLWRNSFQNRNNDSRLLNWPLPLVSRSSGCFPQVWVSIALCILSLQFTRELWHLEIILNLLFIVPSPECKKLVRADLQFFFWFMPLHCIVSKSEESRTCLPETKHFTYTYLLVEWVTTSWSKLNEKTY